MTRKYFFNIQAVYRDGDVGTGRLSLVRDRPIADIADVEEIERELAAAGGYKSLTILTWQRFEDPEPEDVARPLAPETP